MGENKWTDTRVFGKPAFWVYVAKSLVGFAICYAIDQTFPGRRLYWSIISVLLVLSPDDAESRKLPVTRIKANIIGSVIGLSCFMLPIHSFAAMTIGVVLTILICSFLKLGAGTRSALAALVIVLLQEFTDQQTVSAIERMASVIFGCIVGLMVTLLFGFITKKWRKEDER